MGRIFAISVALATLLGAPHASARQRRDEPAGVEKYGAHMFPARGGRVDWGVALSGGGARSALFSIGVLKALYDKEILHEVDVISSTSGGSYASYWLFTGYDPRGEKKFGASLLDNDVFLRKVCALQNADRSNLLPTLQALKRLPSGDRFGTYERAIVKSFGNATPPAAPRLDFLKESLTRPDMPVPYFIINVSLGVGETAAGDGQSSQRARVFELTPAYRGNFELGFRDWAGEEGGGGAGDDTPPPLSDAVAVSGIPSWIDTRTLTFKGAKYETWDGGQTENLAALGLIRRGVKHIVIVDSEQDPRYKFAAYTTLQKMLHGINIRLCVPDIDKTLKRPHCLCAGEGAPKGNARPKLSSAVSLGRAESIIDDGGARVDSHIYYVKMADPKLVLPDLYPRDKISDDEIYERGGKLVCQRETERCPDDIKGKNCAGNPKKCHCDNIKLDFTNEDKRAAFYTYRVRRYRAFLNELRPWRNPWTWSKVTVFNVAGKVWPFLSYNFPHTTTLDLNFHADQLEAYVGLGYLQAVRLERQDGR